MRRWDSSRESPHRRRAPSHADHATAVDLFRRSQSRGSRSHRAARGAGGQPLVCVGPSTRSLFARLDPELWRAVGHSPKALLKRVDESRLESAAQDPVFLAAYNHVLTTFDTYLGERVAPEPAGDGDPGDWSRTSAPSSASTRACRSIRAASASSPATTARRRATRNCRSSRVGLLYRQGYFVQTIDAEGQQLAHYNDSDFDDLPVSPVVDAGGQELHVHVRLGEREVAAKVWRCRVGRIELYLLDTDVPANSADDRHITYRLYGGDATTRLEQEIVLGDRRRARARHARHQARRVAHQRRPRGVPRRSSASARRCAQGIDQDAALEAVAASTVFTTHTPVPAGHDAFRRGRGRRKLRRRMHALGHRPRARAGARAAARRRRRST